MQVPLIHILHDQLNEPVHTLMRRFLKADEAGENKQVATCSRCLEVKEPDSWADADDDQWVHLSNVEKDEAWASKGPIMEMIKYYQTATEYLFSKLPLAKNKDPEKPGITASTAT